MRFENRRGLVKQAAGMLKVLGHPTRLKIAARLCTCDCNVKQLWEFLGLPQALVSQHLARMKDRGVLESNREGSEVYYTVTDPLVHKLCELLKGTVSSAPSIDASRPAEFGLGREVHPP